MADDALAGHRYRFRTLAASPGFTRAFRPEEEEMPGRDAVVILGRTMWEQEFAADGGVLDRTVRISVSSGFRAICP